MKNTKVRRLVESALMIAVGTLLSMVKFDMPMGGGMTLCSMLPLILISHRYGWKWGTFTAFVYSLLQLTLGMDNVRYASTFIMSLGIILFDYVVAYTVIGLSGAAEKFVKDRRAAVMTGTAVTFFLRFLCHFITGMWIWDALWPNEFGMASAAYSAAYNGWYMLGELILTEVVIWLIWKPLGRYFTGEDLR